MYCSPGYGAPPNVRRTAAAMAALISSTVGAVSVVIGILLRLCRPVRYEAVRTDGPRDSKLRQIGEILDIRERGVPPCRLEMPEPADRDQCCSVIRSSHFWSKRRLWPPAIA